ncbi:MAG: tetratricopeptide repeat protein [Proteobacteria bacterium]|nr:tetratricopeptide repeat protein [Pseudomonadota bacterium]
MLKNVVFCYSAQIMEYDRPTEIYKIDPDKGPGRRILGMRRGAFIAIAAGLALIAAIVFIRQSFMGDTREEAASQARDKVRRRDISALIEAAMQNPNSAGARYDLAKALADAGRHEEAIEEYKKALNLDRKFERAHMGMGLSYEELGLFDDAIKAYREALRTNSGNAEAQYRMGVSLANLGRDKEAISYFARAITMDPTYAGRPSAPETAARGTPESRPGDTGEAAAPEAGPEAPPPEAETEGEEETAPPVTGRLEDEFAMPKDVMDQFGESILYSSDSAAVNIGLGTLFNSLGQYPMAIQSFAKAVELEPANAAAHLGLGLAHLGAGDRPAAVAQYNILTALDPASAAKLLDALNK